MKHQKSPSSESGQALVLFTLMLVAFIGFCALVVDVGRVYAERRYMQNGADAGALAVAKAAGEMSTCNSGVYPCANNLVSKLKQSEAIALARAQVESNQSLIGGYQGAIEVKVWIRRYDFANTVCPVDPAGYIELNSNSGQYLPGDTCKVRVGAEAHWNTWFPIPTGSGNGLSTRLANAGALAAAIIVGQPDTETPPGPTWPMVRRRSTVDETNQVPPNDPYLFWSSDVARTAENRDGDGSGSWNSVIDVGLHSTFRDLGDTSASYSPTANPMRQTIEPAMDSADSTWGQREDRSCLNMPFPFFNCGTFWGSQSNRYFPADASYPSIDEKRDMANWIYYGFPGFSLTNEWYDMNCSGSKSSTGSPDCQVPDQTEFSTAAGSFGYGYKLGINPDEESPYYNTRQWSAKGDWVETYPNANLGNNLSEALKGYIDRLGAPCSYSDELTSKGVRLGDCVTRVMYLWEGGQVYDRDQNSPTYNQWVPWNPDDSASRQSTQLQPDRVHLVEWWPFTFYYALADVNSSEIWGFFGSYSLLGPPPDGGGLSYPPSGKMNYYFLVGE